ncbi:MAG: hypothetical protein EBU90_28930 [Proteobacteria bacterium]|nr:hypothetical protein [Pseudomonadota bacterium]
MSNLNLSDALPYIQLPTDPVVPTTCASIRPVYGCNTNSGWYSNINGGCKHSITGCHSTIGGGCFNIINSEYSTIGGGFSSRISNYYDGTGGSATIGGGKSNSISAKGSTISGGLSNLVTNSYSTIGGGLSNTASGYASTIAGGYKNCISGSSLYSTIVGGYSNFTNDKTNVVIIGNCITALTNGYTYTNKLEIVDNSPSLILRSPNGTRYSVSVSNTGVLTVTTA